MNAVVSTDVTAETDKSTMEGKFMANIVCTHLGIHRGLAMISLYFWSWYWPNLKVKVIYNKK